MKYSWYAVRTALLGLMVFSVHSPKAWSDQTWQWAASGYGVTVFIKTIHGCTEENDSKVLIKVVNNQDFALDAEFRVTNAYWTKKMSVELKANATDSSLSIVPDDRTCRPLVERLEASPKDQPLAEGEPTE
jgi:hypothetical protein